MRRAGVLGMLAAVALATAMAQQNPWNDSDLIEPEALASRLAGSSGPKPAVVFVGFPVLYRAAHIPGAILAGPDSKREGLEALREAVSKLPHDAEIVIYCGCCPFERCPNVRPAYSELRRMGFTRIRVLNIPTNMSKDWIDKGLPVEKGK